MSLFVVVGECGGGGKIHQLASVQRETNEGQYFCKVGALLYQLGGMQWTLGFPQLWN